MSFLDDVKAEIAAQLTPAVGVIAPDDSALGFGVDLSCVRSVTDDLRELDPNSREGIAEMLFRFMTSVRETIPDAPGRGLGVQGWVSAGVTFNQLRAYGNMIRGEADQDDRIDSTEVDVKLEGARAIPSLRFVIRITPKVPGLQPFTMIVVVPQSGEALLEILRR